MKIYLFFLIFLLPTIFFNSQTTVSGNVSNENQVALSGVLVVNINNDNQTFTDQNGYFLINARSGNELRFIRQNYERVSLKINFWNSHFLHVVMIYVPTDIEEVRLAFVTTGDLAKDLKRLPKDDKKRKLNKEIFTYLKYKQTEVIPENKMPSDFAPRDFGKGQVSLFDIHGGGITGAFAKLIKKKQDITEPNFNETNDFLKKLIEEVNPTYYYDLGVSHEQLIQFLADANFQLKLAKMYRNNFKIQILEKLLHDYMKTYSFKTTK